MQAFSATRRSVPGQKAKEAQPPARTGNRWRFRNHGETGVVFREVSRAGDDLDLADERGRTLRRVPLELLVQVKP
jgi:hypothetical protein